MSIRLASSGFALALVAALATAAMGCSKDSSDIDTRGISASYIVELDPLPAPGKVTLTAHLEDPKAPAGTGDIKLSNGDGLFVSTDKNDNVPLGGDGSDDGDYKGTLDQLDRKTFTFHLHRTSGTSAETSVISVPDSLALTDSPNNKTYAATDMVHFAYSNPASGSVKLSADHRNCTADIAISLGDTSVKDLSFSDSGTLDVPVTKLYPGTPSSGDCVDIAITRVTTARADGALATESGLTARRTDHYTIHIK